MKTQKIFFSYISVFCLKLGVLPLLFLIFTRYFGFHAGSIYVSLGAWLLILSGILGALVADINIIRFGEGTPHGRPRPKRLVDWGIYARTRHPFFWFFLLFQLGWLIFFFGISTLTLLLFLILSVVGGIYLRYYQEHQLRIIFGKAYEKYAAVTPFFYWRYNIPERQKVQLLQLIIWLLGLILFRYLYRIRVEGLEHIPKKPPFLIVANHESYLDPFLFGVFVPFQIKYVTTADVFSTRLMRFLLKGMGTIPIRRHRQDVRAIRTMIRLINSGEPVCIFPEGGRSLDGLPQPVLKETMKLIQRCRVPILPVHLEGAYEIWPRWANNRRRGKVKAIFKPVIPVHEQKDLDILSKVIKQQIFESDKVYHQVRSREIAAGVERLLWACPQCVSHDSIRSDSGNLISCIHCGQSWQMDSHYHIHPTDQGKSFTPASWRQNIRGLIRPKTTSEMAFTLEENEDLYLYSPLEKYEKEGQELFKGNLHLGLTNQRFILSLEDKIKDHWPLSQITVLTLDFHHAISIGVSGFRHTFFLRHNEQPLKWHDHFYYLIND